MKFIDDRPIEYEKPRNHKLGDILKNNTSIVMIIKSPLGYYSLLNLDTYQALDETLSTIHSLVNFYNLNDMKRVQIEAHIISND